MGCFSSNEKSPAPGDKKSTPQNSPTRKNPTLATQLTERETADAEGGDGFDVNDIQLEENGENGVQGDQKKQENADKLSQYEMGEELGRGHFATVRLATHIPTGRTVAVKIIAKTELLNNKSKVSEEIRILRAVGQHPNVVSLLDTFEDEFDFYLVMEYCSGGDVFSYIVESGKFSEELAVKVCKELALALKHIHSKGVVHRDLKPENILLGTRDPKAPVKVADFGLSKLMRSEDHTMRTVCGTWAYCAPEVIKRKPYSPAVDNWTLGVLMFTLLAGYHPFDIYGDLPEPELLRRVVHVKFDFDDAAWDDVSEDAKELICKLIKYNPEERLSLDAFLASSWITRGSVSEETHALPKSLAHLTSFQGSRTKFRTMVYVKLASQKFRNSIGGPDKLRASGLSLQDGGASKTDATET